MIGTMALTRMLMREFKILVIASGGIPDGREIATALIFEAQAAQLGTIFLAWKEVATSEPYRRLARGLTDKFMEEMEQDNTILPFPAQNAYTRDICSESVKQEKSDYLSLWAGTGVNEITSEPVGNIITRLFEETDQAIKNPLSN